MNNIDKAIKSLQNIIEYWYYRPSEVEAAKLAISALEKQLPRPPEHKVHEKYKALGKKFLLLMRCDVC